jgi:hypothetical protein
MVNLEPVSKLSASKTTKPKKPIGKVCIKFNLLEKDKIGYTNEEAGNLDLFENEMEHLTELDRKL